MTLIFHCFICFIDWCIGVYVQSWMFYRSGGWPKRRSFPAFRKLDLVKTKTLFYTLYRNTRRWSTQHWYQCEFFRIRQSRTFQISLSVRSGVVFVLSVWLFTVKHRGPVMFIVRGLIHYCYILSDEFESNLSVGRLKPHTLWYLHHALRARSIYHLKRFSNLVELIQSDMKI